MKFTLQKATETDLDFIWRLRVVTMKDMITSFSEWDEHAQRNYAAESLNGYIVLVAENRAGVITISDWEDQLHVTWLAVLPHYQGQGLGTELIKYAQSQAL